MTLDQWCFFVAATKAIAARSRSQHSIGLKSLTDLCKSDDPMWYGPADYAELRSAVLRVAATVGKVI